MPKAFLLAGQLLNDQVVVPASFDMSTVFHGSTSGGVESLRIGLLEAA